MSEVGRDLISTEAEFRKELGSRIEPLLELVELLRGRTGTSWLKRHFTRLVASSHEIETFLDDHGARNNKLFSYLAEIIASIRGLGKAAISLKHIESRFERYGVGFEAGEESDFQRETLRTGEFLVGSISSLADALTVELASLGLSAVVRSLTDDQIREEGPRFVLPHNIDEGDVLDEEQKIAEVATRYLAVSTRVAGAASRRIADPAELKAHVLRHLDEEKARGFESQIHSVQSKYDTYIRNTLSESKTPSLPKLRGHASLALHLMEMGVELVHFYVRHENDIRFETAKDRISRAIDKLRVLDRSMNYAFYFASTALRRGASFAEDVLRIFVKTSEVRLVLRENEVLHARPVSLIVRIVNHYGTPVRMVLGDEDCNAGSIMEMILAVGSHPSKREVVFRGDDRALADIRLLFESGLGENGVQNLPAQLDYIRVS